MDITFSPEGFLQLFETVDRLKIQSKQQEDAVRKSAAIIHKLEDDMRRLSQRLGEESSQEQGQEQEQEQEAAITATQNATTSPGASQTEGQAAFVSTESLFPARSYAPKNRKFELSDADVTHGFKELDSTIFALVHKHLEQTDQTWVKTTENELWTMAAVKTNTLSAMRVPWFRKQIANTIYEKLFKPRSFALDDEGIEQGLVKAEDWLMSERFEGSKSDATRWRSDPSGSAQNQHREQNDCPKTQVAKELAEQINKTLSSPFQDTAKADAALKRVCYEAVACALLLRSSPKYSWEQWDSETTRQLLVDANAMQLAGPFLNQEMSASERNVAFTVFGPVMKNYSTIENGKSVERKVVITKPVAVLY